MNSFESSTRSATSSAWWRQEASGCNSSMHCADSREELAFVPPLILGAVASRLRQIGCCAHGRIRA